MNFYLIMRNIFLLILIVVQSFAQKTKKLTLLYTNDLHANFEPMHINWIDKNRKVGGFANLSTLVKEEKSKNKNALYFDAGDFFTGPYHSFLTKGEAVINVMNSMPFDAVCIGNHEFDHGWQNVTEQFKKANFDILNGNIYLKNTEELLWNKPYKTFENNGIKIGVVGMHGEFAFYDTIADEMIRGVECRNEEIYLKKYVEELSSKVDIIILLIHEGIPGRQSTEGSSDVSRSLQKDIELAQHVPGIDVIITGHAHKGTKEALYSNGTIIVSTDALGIELGKLEIEYSKKKDKIINYQNQLKVVYDDEIIDDFATLSAINQSKEKLSDISSEHVCDIEKDLTRSYGEESLLGNMVADALLFSNPSADFAVTNSGGLREDILGPKVTVGQLISTFPFPNTVVEIELNGNEIIDIFEHGATLKNGILQVSKGIEMQYSEDLPLDKRISKLSLNGIPLDPNKTYKIITNNFLADGGDGFLAFKKGHNKKNTGIPVLEILRNYLKTFTIYQPKIEGRVVRLK